MFDPNNYKKVMKALSKVLKWTGLVLISFITVLILAGLAFRFSSSKASSPPGKLVDIEGVKLHIHAEGKKDTQPTLVIEGGGGLPTEFGHWLNEGLKDSMRVVRYDRAGIGYSDACKTPRDPETIARELHALLENAGESPPYIMMGHSIGGPYIRVFTELYPDEVVALFFLDATHPDHVERYNAPKPSDFKYKGYLWTIGAQAFLADLGILPLYDRYIGTPYYGPGLPDEINTRFKKHLHSGKIFRAYQQEIEYYHETLKRSGQVEDFGTLPIRAFNAISEDPAQRKLDSTHFDQIRNLGTHKEYAELSTNGKHVGIPGNHVSIFTKKENATIICIEVLQLLEELKTNPQNANTNYQTLKL